MSERHSTGGTLNALLIVRGRSPLIHTVTQVTLHPFSTMATCEKNMNWSGMRVGMDGHRS